MLFDNLAQLPQNLPHDFFLVRAQAYNKGQKAKSKQGMQRSDSHKALITKGLQLRRVTRRQKFENFFNQMRQNEEA